jgi:23S rRNA (cytosine1962-C5)-methyltransferase
VTVKAGHVQPLWAGHPWVFKQAVDRVDEGLASGGEALVIDPHGKVLGRGLYSGSSAISVRLFTHEGSRAVDRALFTARFERALALRRAMGLPDATHGRETTGFRLVHGEGDGLPGLIVDVLGDVLVVQFGTAGLKRLEGDIVAALAEVVGPAAILDRTPKSIADAEGFAHENGPRVVHGELPVALSFQERGVRYELPIELGQKTGFYFDQRPLRDRIAELSRGSKVLDAFCYVGAIAQSAIRGGAREVLGVDKSVPAIEAAKRCAELNPGSEEQPVGERLRFEAIEAEKAFKRAADEGGYDIVICDPPKLAPRRKHKKQASGGYRKLAEQASLATAPGGLLAFCTCSGAIPGEQLQRSLALGARDAGRRAIIVDRCFQGPDHPVLAAFPEGLYLKVLIARVEPL